MKKLIEKKVGKNYLFAIPSSTSLLVAKYNPKYLEMLKVLISVDQDPHKVSERVYICKNGKYDYAEKNEILRIIK